MIYTSESGDGDNSIEFSHSGLSSESDSDFARRQELLRKQNLRSRRRSSLHEDAGEQKRKEKDEEVKRKRRRSGVALTPSVAFWKTSICHGVNHREAEIKGISPEKARIYMRNKEILMTRASHRNTVQYLHFDDSLEPHADSTHTSSTSNVQSTRKLSTCITLERRYARAVRDFQTDQYTLTKRLENQERACDVAASNMKTELQMLTSTIGQFASIPTLSKDHEGACYLLRTHVDILEAKAFDVLEKSVLHGYYKKEKMLATNMETVIAYIEQLQKHLNELREQYGDVKTQ